MVRPGGGFVNAARTRGGAWMEASKHARGNGLDGSCEARILHPARLPRRTAGRGEDPEQEWLG